MNSVEFKSEETGKEAPSASATPDPNRPAWLPEQFKSPEDFAKAFADTQAKLTQTSQELAALRKGAEATSVPQEETQKTPEKKTVVSEEKPKAETNNSLEVPEGDGESDDKKVEDQKALETIDFSPYTEEFVNTGDVSEENRAKIAESLKGIFGDDARSVVDDFINGKKALVTNTRAQLMEPVGGEENYAKMMEWAKDNLSPDEKKAYNKAVNSQDFHTARFAIEALHAKFTGVNGKEPTFVDGELSSGDGFKSLHEMKAAISDPRYDTDPDYRKMVEQKALRSNV